MEDKDLILQIMEWKGEYRNIFAIKIGDDLFVVRPLTRREFKDIYGDDTLSDAEKEESFCETATLYPEDYDFSSCMAGIPSMLAEKILSESMMLLDGKARTKLNRYRDEMELYENQITCIITEAFPTLTPDVVEDWDMDKILYNLSRAEWVLSKMRGMPFVKEGEAYEDPRHEVQNAPSKKQPEPYYVQDDFTRDITEFDSNQMRSVPNPHELEKLKQQFPEIDWENDSVLSGEFDFEKDAKEWFDPEDAE